MEEKKGFEKIEPMYLAPRLKTEFERITAQKIFRVEIGAGRHYRNEAGQTFTSITTFLDQVMPPNKRLQMWRESMIEDLGSAKAASDYVTSTADFGTALHIAVADFCRLGHVDWKVFNQWAYSYMIEIMKLDGHTLFAAVEELTRDFAGIVQFFADYEAEVLAVEVPVFSSHGFATLIDIIVEMNEKCYTEKTPPEKRKRIFAGGNLKSGKKGFHPTHIFQLCGERMAFNETYGDIIGPMVHVFNLAPTAWRTTPGYKFANQTSEIDETNVSQLFDLFVQTGKLNGVLAEPSKTFIIFEGVTAYGSSPVSNMVELTYDQNVIRRLKDNPKIL